MNHKQKKKSGSRTSLFPRRSDSTRALINTKAITEHSLITYKGDEIVLFLIKPTNVSVLSFDALRVRVNALMNVLKGFAEVEILCLNSRESFENNKRYLLERYRSEQIVPIRELIEKDYDHLNQIQVQTATAREFLLLIRLRNIGEKEVFPYLSRIEKMIREQGFKTRRADYEDIKRILAIYFAQDVTSENFDSFDGERWLFVDKQSDYKAATLLEQEAVLKSFLDMIAPSTVKFNVDHFICGNTWRCVWAIRAYPTATEEQALLQHLGEKAGVTLHIYTRLVTPNEERRILQAADKANRFKASTSDIREMVTAESDQQDVANMIMSAHRNKEPFLHTAVYIELIADSEEKFRQLQDNISAELNRAKISVDKLSLSQQQGFLSVMPSGYNAFGEQFERMLPASSVANLYPFAYSGKTDSNGFYIGRDRFGSSIIVDFDKRDEDKSNASILILGNSGQGKSYLLKLLICNLLESGKNIACLDPEGEYRTLTEKLGGYYIDLTGGRYILNVLEPRQWSSGDTEEADSPKAFTEKSRLSQHISFLRDFFRSYKSFTEAELDTIEIMLEKLYHSFGITDETDFSRLSAADYPILSDLHDLMEQSRQLPDDKSQLYTPELLQSVARGLHSICKGPDSRYFNGHTNVESKRFLTFGVKDLMEGGKNIKDAMLFNVLSFINHSLISIGNTAAIFEELHVFLSNPVAVGYIRSAMKRVRKRESSVVLASQNIEDFLLPGIAELTKPLFAIPTHQFLFHPGTIDKTAYMDALQLKEAEYNLIKSCQTNICLMKCGNERYNLMVGTPEYKAALYGKEGGR